MDWDQIESKWVLMTRRIRADWPDEPTEVAGQSARTSKSREALAASIADSQTLAVKDAASPTPAK